MSGRRAGFSRVLDQCVPNHPFYRADMQMGLLHLRLHLAGSEKLRIVGCQRSLPAGRKIVKKNCEAVFFRPLSRDPYRSALLETLRDADVVER